MAAEPLPPSRRRRRSARTAPIRDDRRIDWFETVPVAVLIVAALLFGGSADPLSDMAVRIVALLVLVILSARLPARAWGRLRPAWIVALALIAVAAIELVPLPPALWHALPGRAPFADLLDALKLGAAARPLSLDPEATRATLIAVLPGFAAFVAALVAGRRALGIWTWIIVAGATLTALIGAFQIAGFRDFYLYEHANVGQLTGLFANRNHASDMLLIGIALLAGMLGTADGLARELRIGMIALIGLLAVAVLLTTSRFGIVLLGGELIAVAAMLATRRRRSRRLIGIVALVLVTLAALASLTPRVGEAFGRFGSLADDLRPEFWSSTLYATGQYWPVGSGLGTFVPVYTTVEQLDTMPTQIVNHAHNEYLELTLELGILAPILILSYLAALIVALIRNERAGGDPAIRGAALGIAVLLAHSTNEFPLRNAALMVAFGLLNGIVLAAVQQKTSLPPARSVSH